MASIKLTMETPQALLVHCREPSSERWLGKTGVSQRTPNALNKDVMKIITRYQRACKSANTIVDTMNTMINLASARTKKIIVKTSDALAATRTPISDV